MASTSQSNIRPPPTPLRLPKLSYRNKFSDAESISTVSTDASRVTVSTNPTSPLHSSFCPSPREPPTNTLSPSIRSPSIVHSSMGPKTPNNPTKKKAGFFTGLFAKEPSAQALADYQKHLLKQGPNRTSTNGLPGVSSTKLPPTVPKVNSKWDGVPQTVKEKERQKQERRRSTIGPSRKVSTVTSAGSEARASSTAGSQKSFSPGPAGGMSPHSNTGSNRLADLYGWEGHTIPSSSPATIDFAAAHRPATARMQTSHSAPAAPERPSSLERTSFFPPYNTLNPLSSSQASFAQSSSSLSGSSCPPSYSHSPALTPFESLPVTPEEAPPMNVLPSSLSEMRLQDDIKTTTVEAPPSVDEVIIKSAGLNILGPPATAKRRPKATPHQSSSAQPKTSGPDMQLNSILKKATPKDTPSRAARSSQIPSPDSASPVGPKRHDPSRERLGFGMNSKNQAIAPWSSPDQPDDAVEGERIITPTPEGGQSLRRKGRMSLFK